MPTAGLLNRIGKSVTKVVTHAVTVFCRTYPHPNRQIKGHDYTDGDGLTMIECIAITGFGLKGMTERMTKVEQGPDALFGFIL